MSHLTINPSNWSRRLEPRNHQICVAYASRKFTTKQIAARYALTERQVERIATQGGVIRTRAESNRVAGKLQPRHRLRG